MTCLYAARPPWGGARESFGYDALGRRTSMANSEVSLSFVYDALNRMTQATNHTLGQTIGYGYDAAGNRTSMDGPLGQVTYLYDAKNRLAEQHDPASGVYRLAYDAADRRSGLTYPNGVTTEYDYDGASRLTDLLTRDPQGTVLDGYAYSYDAVGNRTEMRSLRDSAVHDYTYDSVDRLTRWQRGPDRFEAYTYDRVGNRTELDDERGSVTYSYDDANRLLQQVRTLTDGGSTTTTDYGWDPNGNLLTKQVEDGSLTTYTWDALNRLTSVTDATGLHTYGYDPQGIRVRETNGSDTTRLLHAGEDIIGTYKAGALDTYFTHGPGIDEPWAQVKPNASTNPVAYLHHDGLGSVTAISNPQGQLAGATTYAPFGGVESTTGPATRYGYTSRELDPTGQMYYRARYYQPGVGRFASRDPARLQPETPQSLHAYAYVLNSPESFTDPFGKVPRSLDAQIAGYLAVMNLIILIVAACYLANVSLDCYLAIAAWFFAIRGLSPIAVLISRVSVVLSFAFLVAGFWYEYDQGIFSGDELVFITGWLFSTHLAILLADWVLSRTFPPSRAGATAAGFLLLGATLSVVLLTRKLVDRIEAGELRRQ